MRPLSRSILPTVHLLSSIRSCFLFFLLLQNVESIMNFLYRSCLPLHELVSKDLLWSETRLWLLSDHLCDQFDSLCINGYITLLHSKCRLLADAPMPHISTLIHRLLSRKHHEQDHTTRKYIYRRPSILSLFMELWRHVVQRSALCA